MSEHAAAVVAEPQKPVVQTDISVQPELLLQRKCACGATAGFAGACDECSDKRLRVQRRAASSDKLAGVPSIVEDVLGANGEELDEATRAFMESRFGHDFSRVRVHTDARAAESARAVNALAYTVGQHVVFGSGHYQPQTQTGRHLIAHELTHTMQQGGEPRGAQAKLEIGEEKDELEKEADRVADRVMKGGLSGTAPPLQPPPTPPQSSKVLIQRAPDSQSSANPSTAEDASADTAPPNTGLIVEDEAEQLSPGQMRKSEFLAELRTSVCAAADTELARVGRNTESCPYISRAFAHYQTQDSRRLERGLRRYAPEASGATTAQDYIQAVSVRVARAVGVWAETGEIADVPEELAAVMSGGLVIGGISGLASMAGRALGGLLGGAGRALSGLGRMLFKERAGGARAEQVGPAAIHTQLNEGQTLDANLRSRMESAFSYDFSRVRVYTDSHAAELSTRLNARAFTLGNSVGFGAGEYRPGTLVGDALIAHELAHVVQQNDAGQNYAAPVQTQAEGATDALEEDADAAAVGAVASTWGGLKRGLVKFSKRAMPRLKSGLQLQRCSHDYEIRGLSTEAADDSIFFERRSANIEDSQQTKINDLKEPPARALRLYSFVSEDENIPPVVGTELAHARYVRVNEALRRGPNAHTGDQIAGDSTHPGEDTTSSRGQIDYRRMRKVKVVPASESSSGERDCSGGGEQICSDESKFTSAQSRADTMLTPAINALDHPLTDPAKGWLDSFFHTTDDTTRTMAASVVKTNLTNVKAHVMTQMTPVGTQGTAADGSDRVAGHVCANECTSTCGPNTVAFNNGRDDKALMTLCDTPSHSAFMQQSDEAERATTLIHEGLHGITISVAPTTGPPPPATGAKDFSYDWQRLIRFLDTPTALKNNDSYVLYINAVNGLSTASGADIMDDPEAGEDASRAVAWLEGWLIWASQETSSLYGTINRSRTAGAWDNSHYERLMTLIAPLFEMTVPPTLPNEEDQVKVAAINDRLSRLRRIPNRSLTINRIRSGSTRWEEGPTGPLTVGPDFYNIPAGTGRHRAQLDLIMKQLLKASPDISSGAEDRYMVMIDRIRQNRGGGSP